MLFEKLFYSLLFNCGPASICFSIMEMFGLFRNNLIGALVVYLTSWIFLFLTFNILNISLVEDKAEKKKKNY